MKLAILLGIAVPAIRGELLTYPDDISLFEFSWANPDQGDDVETGPADGSLMTDGVATIGSGETLTNPIKGVWGSLESATTVGMDGTFQATTLNIGDGFAYWSISSASVVFDGQCFTDDTTASAFYYDFSSGSRGILTATATSDANNVWTFTADITVCLYFCTLPAESQ